ncbi:FRG domain-containing protein [Nocardioides korecus]
METIEIFSVTDFISDSLARFSDEQPIWFRGQARSPWKLEPSLIRKKGLDEERSLRNEFERDAYPQLNRVQMTGGEIGEWDWLFLQQHYHVPTRLMDWSESPLVGMYFALDDTEVLDPEDDAAVWALKPQELNALSHIKKVNAWSVPMCGRSTDLDLYTLNNIENPSDRELLPLAAAATRRFDRISAQAGVFTVSHPGRPEALDDLAALAQGALFKYVIKKDAKEEMRRHMNRLGVTAASIFPDLEHLGRRVGSRLS